MSICTNTFDAAQRYLYQLTHNEGDAFKATLAEDVQQSHCRLNGQIQTNPTTNEKAEKVFRWYQTKLLDVTTNFEVKEWSVKCYNLTAECDYAVEEDKSDPQGLQGRYRMQGHTSLVFVRDPSNNNLLIKKIDDTTAAIQL